MLGLDTKVLVRFLVRDDAHQFARARRLIEREEGSAEDLLVSLMVLVETEFADCLIGARNRRLGCSGTATFDAKAVRLPGFVGL